jgi:anaphase-promoting complex subunit 5
MTKRCKRILEEIMPQVSGQIYDASDEPYAQV